MAIRVPIRELRARLSERDEGIEIVERGQLIGQLLPVSERPEARMEAPARRGLGIPARGKLPPMRPLARVRGRKTVAELLVEDRG